MTSNFESKVAFSAGHVQDIVFQRFNTNVPPRLKTGVRRVSNFSAVNDTNTKVCTYPASRCLPGTR
eukprot:3163508-Rhodomonas_salina.1